MKISITDKMSVLYEKDGFISFESEAFANSIEAQSYINAHPKMKLKTLESLKLEKIQELNEHINKKYESYLKAYPKVEVESFTQKALESNLVLNDNLISFNKTPVLKALVGEDIAKRTMLANAIKEKLDINMRLESYAVLMRDKIKAANSKDELDGITWG